MVAVGAALTKTETEPAVVVPHWFVAVTETVAEPEYVELQVTVAELVVLPEMVLPVPLTDQL
jgi:hypothetical protein